MQKLKWSTEIRATKELLAWAENPRKITKVALKNLKDKITQSGFHSVIVIDTDNTILSGNQRKTALIELNVNKVNVLVPNRKLSDEERTKIALESNFTDGTWDFEALKSFDLDLLMNAGFDEKELQDIWSENLEIQEEEWNDEEEIKKAKNTNIKLGDIFSLGKHRLACIDSLDQEAVKRLMGDARADMVNVDLPYNINLSYNKGVGNKSHYGGKTNDNKTESEYRDFVKTIMENSLSVIKPDAHYIFWCDERWVWLFQTLYKELGINSKRLLIWLKNSFSPTPQVAFNKMAEFAVYGTVGSPYLNKKVNDLHEIINKNITTGNRVSEEILDQLNILMVKRLPGNQYKHPTQKSALLHEKALRRCTRPGDIVVDLSAGSGSIMSACEQLNRVAYLADYEPIFCQVILNHFKKLTGIKPIKIYEEK